MILRTLNKSLDRSRRLIACGFRAEAVQPSNANVVVVEVLHGREKFDWLTRKHELLLMIKV